MSSCKIDSHFVDGYSRLQNTFIHYLLTTIFDQYKAVIKMYRREGSSDHFKIERIRTDNAGQLKAELAAVKCNNGFQIMSLYSESERYF